MNQENKKFYQNAVEYLRYIFTDETNDETDEELISKIKVFEQRASEEYCITEEADVMAFIDLQFRIENNFDLAIKKYPWAKEILTSRSINAEDKIDKLRVLFAETTTYKA